MLLDLSGFWAAAAQEIRAGVLALTRSDSRARELYELTSEIRELEGRRALLIAELPLYSRETAIIELGKLNFRYESLIARAEREAALF